MEERRYYVVQTDELGICEMTLSHYEVVEPLGDGPLAVGDSRPMAAYVGDGIRAQLALERDEYSYFARPEIDVLRSDGQWQRQTGKRCHMATRDPFTRPPAGSLNDRPELPFPPWEHFGYWQGGKGDDRWLCLAGFVEEHVARLTIETEHAGEADVPIAAETGAWLVALRGRHTRDFYFRFFDAAGEFITAWGERKWHYAQAEFVSRRGIVTVVPTDVMRDRFFGDPWMPAEWGFEPTARDERLWRALARREGVFVRLDSRITLRWPDGSTEETYGDVSQPRWIPWAHPQELGRIDWDEVYDWEMTEDETELRIIGAKKAAMQVRGRRPITYDDELQRVLLAHRLIAALLQRSR